MTPGWATPPTQTDKGLAALLDCVSGAPRMGKPLSFSRLSDADWQRFTELAVAHQLAPLAYHQLRECFPGAAPSWVMGRLGPAYYATLADNTVLYERLRHILAALQQAGIEVLLLKGAVFAQTLYPNIGTRPIGDLDLVVALESLGDAEAILQGFGYRPEGGKTRPREYHFRYGGELPYAAPESWPPVDLHWRVIFGEWARLTTAVRDEDFWSRAQPVTSDGVEARQLAVEDSILHQVWHVAVVHLLTDLGLRAYVDLDRTIRAGARALDWTGFVDLVRGVRMTTAVYLALEPCVRLLDTPVPAEVLGAFRPSAFCRKLVSQTLGHGALFQRRPMGRRRAYLLRLLLVDRPSDLARLLFRTFFPEGEWLALRYELDGGRPRLVHRLGHPLHVLSLRGEI